MLDGLDQIDWRRLGHAYGSAGDVPGQLRALRSPDPQERQTAIGALYANIFHQGSRHEASAYALPFLLELAGDPATPDPELGLYLITALAIGYDERWLPEGFPVAEFRRAADGGRELLAAKPPPCDEDDDEDDEDDEKKEYVEYEYVESLSAEDQGRLWGYIELAAYDAARAGVPLLRSLLTRPEPGVRVGAAYALAWFPEDAAGSVAALAAVRDAASDADEVATAVVASGLLGSAPDAGLLADPRPVVRWAAAVGRARVLGAETDQATVDELLAWVAASPDGSRRRPTGDGVGVPFHDGDLAGYAGLSLRLVDPRHTDRAFDALLGRLPTVTGSAALPVATEALRLAFPDGRLSEGVPPAALAPRQRRLVEVLARSPEPWQINGRTFGNFSMLVCEYGLPRSREAMLTYLGGDPA